MHKPLAGLLLVAAALAFGPVGSPPKLNGPSPDWLARAQREIAEREYRASRNDSGLQAPNRAHDLRTYFDPTGIRVHGRAASGGTELLRLSLAGVGRAGALVRKPPGELISEDARVEIRREGLIEWYVNSAEGLEQGFTFEERPEGEGALQVELAVDGGSRASLRGDGVIFATAARRKLSYGKLAASDASGRALPSRFELANAQRLRIVVDDSGATYPIAIDPLLTETADSQLESDLSAALLGSSVAGAGDVNGDGYADVIVGVPNYDAGQTDEGAAFVFHGSASGVADGNPVTAATQLEGNQTNALFGRSVAGAGDVNGDGYADVIVGATDYDAGQTDEGAAFVFLGSSSGIADGDPSTAQAQLESNQATAHFGYSVAGAGDVNSDGYADVIVGATDYDAGQTNEGAAFVFLGSGSGISDGDPSTAAAQLESNQAGALLGWSVAGAGDVDGDGYADAIVGAPEYDAGNTNEGAAFLFLGSSSGIADGNPSTAATQLESNQPNAYFGRSVAGAGDVNGDGDADVIVGAYLYDAGQTDEGAAFVFLGTASGIADANPSTAAAQLESNQASAEFGASLASAGDVNGDGYADMIVGAHLYDAGQTNEGAAFVFLGTASGIADGNPSTAAAQLESNQPSAEFGASVARAGDVNGDGYADVIVGAPFFSAGQTAEGAAFVFLGIATGIADGNPSTAVAQTESNQAYGQLGYSVAGAGDVNGDGYADVIVGTPNYDAGQADEGAAFLFLGSSSGIADGNPSTAATQLESNQPNAYFGRSVAGAGDVNGDGYADVIIGANSYTAGQVDEGAAFVFLGSASGIADGDPSTANAQIESDQSGALLGVSVAGAGDVNGDGYADVIVGAYVYDAGQTREGAAFIFLGSATGIADGNPSTAAAQLESNQANAQLGDSVAGAGDVNGDGYADVIVGAPLYKAGETGEGAAFIFLGSATGIADGNPSTAAAQLESNQPGALLGLSVAGAGDANGDGYADVIVGAYGYDAGETSEGAAFVFLGSATGIADGDPATATAQLESNQASAFLGLSVAGAGDVNGDGYADVIAGAIDFDAGEPDEGAAFVFLGNSAGRPVLARQRRGDASGVAVQAWGWSLHASQFTAELRANHPEGTGRVKAQFEACPPGVAFGNPGCMIQTAASWVQLIGAVPEVVLSHTFSGLAADTLYRWRARVLHAPATGASPASPAHGPWRRVNAQADEADLRTGFRPPDCADGLDNDADGLIDYPADPGCRNPEWGTESPGCNDGIDNDGDSLIDMADPECGNPWSDNELHGCGLLGIEVVPLLAWAAGRRRRRFELPPPR